MILICLATRLENVCYLVIDIVLVTLKTGVCDVVVCYNKGALGKLNIMNALR